MGWDWCWLYWTQALTLLGEMLNSPSLRGSIHAPILSSLTLVPLPTHGPSYTQIVVHICLPMALIDRRHRPVTSWSWSQVWVKTLMNSELFDQRREMPRSSIQILDTLHNVKTWSLYVYKKKKDRKSWTMLSRRTRIILRSVVPLTPQSRCWGPHHPPERWRHWPTATAEHGPWLAPGHESG